MIACRARRVDPSDCDEGSYVWRPCEVGGTRTATYMDMKTENRGATPPRALCVALAEDDEPLRDLLADVLRGDGFDVVEASDGRALLDAIAAKTPDLVVTDVQMPHVSGLEVLETLRQKRANIPVVIMTATRDRRIRDAALMSGAAAVFQKPFDIDELRSVVFKFLPRAH